MAVNVSARQIERSSLLEKIERTLQRHRLPPDRLEIELTESALLRDEGQAIEFLHGLKARGIRIALDDFGAGYSSLAYLHALPLDKIKIDRSFVKALDHDGDEGARAIVRTILYLGAALNLETIAERVETTEQGRAIAELGCNFGQGYLYGKAMPAPAVAEFLREWRADALAGRKLQYSNVGRLRPQRGDGLMRSHGEAR